MGYGQRRLAVVVLSLVVSVLVEGCATESGPVRSGCYDTWDDVIDRWIGKQKSDLYYELGLPQFHKEAMDGMAGVVWDLTLPNLTRSSRVVQHVAAL